MFRRIASLAAAFAVAATLVFVGAVPATAAPPTDNTNSTAYWQTPGTSETCQKIDGTRGATWTLPAAPAGSVWTKVVIKAGSTGASVDAENNAYYSDATYHHPAGAPGTTWNSVASLPATTFVHPSGKDISHVIYCSAPVPPTAVAGEAAATHEICEQDALRGGVITVALKPGLTYAIAGPSGAVPFDAATGLTAPLPPGDYTVTIAPDAGYALTGPASILLTVSAYDGDCGISEPLEVKPTASVTDQTCQFGALLVGGIITVGAEAGVTYTISGAAGAVAFDPITRATAPLEPGTYRVQPVAKPGYKLTSAADIVLTVGAYDGDCGLVTFPLVAPQAVQTQLSCVSDGRITLSSDQPGLSAVVWTINGTPVTEGTHIISTPGLYTVNATPAPGYSVAADTTTSWPFTFTEPAACELETLALTGSEGSGWYVALAGGLGLLGVTLILSSRRAGRMEA